MITIMMNSLKEKIRNKSLYLIGGTGALLVLLLMTSSNITYKGEKMTGYNDLLPFLMIVVGFIASLLAITTSLQTIPKEYEHKTHHLILVRGIKSSSYLVGLTLSNLLTTLMTLFMIYGSVILFNLIDGSPLHLGRHLATYCILALSTSALSAVVSLLSIRFPLAINGLLGILVLLLGSFHHVLQGYLGTANGFGAKILKALLYIIPDLHSVQEQAKLMLTGDSILFMPMVWCALFILGILVLITITNAKRLRRVS